MVGREDDSLEREVGDEVSGVVGVSGSGDTGADSAFSASLAIWVRSRVNS